MTHPATTYTLSNVSYNCICYCTTLNICVCHLFLLIKRNITLSDLELVGKHSAGSDRLVAPTVKLSTVGGSAFSAAATAICDDLPDDAISTEAESFFSRLLRAFLFQHSFLALNYGNLKFSCVATL